MSGNLRARKTNGNGAAANGNGASKSDSATIASGQSKTLINNIPTAYGQAMDKKLDEHQSYEFGGPVGVAAMMIGFPILMCECDQDWRRVRVDAVRARGTWGVIDAARLLSISSLHTVVSARTAC